MKNNGKTLFSIISVFLVAMLILSSCSGGTPGDTSALSGTGAGETNQVTTPGNAGTSTAPGTDFTANIPTDTTNTAVTAEPVFDFDVPDVEEQTFTIQSETENGYSYDAQTNIYTILLAGTYDCYGILSEGQLVVTAGEDDKVTVNLNGCTLINGSASPIYIESADSVDISAKKETENFIYDTRAYAPSDEDISGSGAIYALCDLTVKGSGSLEIISNYNNGIHTKDDLEIKNLTLVVKAVNNALKGNDSVTVESGNITAISSGGDGIKTTSTDTNKDGEQRGTVAISGGTVNIYSACDGIDSAGNADVSGDAVLNIYTDSYSPYSGDVMASGSTTLYLRMSSTVYNAGYTYAAYFYNADGSFVWADMDFFKSAASTTRPGKGGFGGGGFGGGGFGGSSYYYYSVTVPSGYTNVLFYAYTSGQTPGQSNDYYAVTSGDTTLTAAWDTYVISSVSGGKIASSGWTSYQSSSGNTGLDYSCKGIKADNIITISGGTINIQAKDDAIHANFDTVLESTGSKGLGNIMISGGTVTIASDDDGIHADQDLTISGGTVVITNSYEALEANRIYVSDGSVTAYAKDDGINANSKGNYTAYVEISGGYVDIAVPSGDTDTIDSNGTVLISGGIVFLKNAQSSGNSMGGGTIDTERGVSVTGGTVIAIGCIGDKITGSAYSTSVTMASGDYSIKNAAGNTVAEFSLTASYKAYMLWSDAFLSGQTYQVYNGSSTVFSFTK